LRIPTDGSVEHPVGAIPAISILMAVRDGERYLDEALDSLSGQTFRDFEIIVVDDGSRDGTAAMLADWAAREPRLRVFTRSRRGLASSLNFAASVARAPLLARLDADDTALPERLARLYGEMQRRPFVGLLGSSVDLIDEEGTLVGELLTPITHEALVEVLNEGCCLVQSSVIMRREAFRRAGGYRSGLNLGEDFDLWSRMAEVTEIAALPEKLVRYRMHRDSTTARWPIRGALAAVCVVAAAHARRHGEAEPFVAGVPKLRAALALTGRSRESFRNQVRASLLSQRLLRAYVALPVPGVVKVAIRRTAMRLGLRPIYRRRLSWLAGAMNAARSG
jgi:glycosyltransferase involved in cell wall biosynthesis